MKKFVLIFVAILVSIKLIMLIGFTESELIIAGIIFAFYLLIDKIQELQDRIKGLEYKKENSEALEQRKAKQKAALAGKKEEPKADEVSNIAKAEEARPAVEKKE